MTSTTTRKEGLPSSPSQEQALIAAMLEAGQNRRMVLDMVRGQSASLFLDPEFRFIAGIMDRLYADRRALTRPSIEDEIEDSAGGKSFQPDVETYIKQLILTGTLETAEELRQTITDLSEFSASREVISHAESIVESNARGDKPRQLIEEGRSMSSIAPIAWTSSSIGDVVARFGEVDEYAWTMSTGIKALDDVIIGYAPGTYTIVGARTKVGKSTHLLMSALNAAIEEKARVLFASFEMSDKELSWKVLSAESGVAYELVLKAGRTGDYSELSASELAAIDEAKERLKDVSLEFMLPSDLQDGIASVIGRARSEYQMLAPGERMIVFVDYIQLAAKRGDVDGRVAIERGSAALKQLALDLNIPIVTAAQISRRSVEEDGNVAPQVYHLREAGGLEQDADTVLMLHRASVLDPSLPDHVIEYNIRVCRTSPPTSFNAFWIGQYQTIVDWPEELEEYRQPIEKGGREE